MLAAVRTAAGTWVTKTNVTDYLRCPYAFWLLHTRVITREQLFGPVELARLESGVAFEAGVFATATPIETPPGGIAQLFAENHVLMDIETLLHPELRLAGRPDGVVTASGVLEPIEVKGHRAVTHMDRLELAFYWLLLSVARTAVEPEPRGWVFVRRGDEDHERVEVSITSALLDEVRQLVADVRRARREGVSPRECRCEVCETITGGEVSRAMSSGRDFTMIRGIGPHHRELLMRSGYAGWDALVFAEPAEVCTRVQAATAQRISATEVARWQAHALSYEEGFPVPRDGARPFPVAREYIALDLEYVPGQLVWMIGIRVVGDGPRARTWLADSPEREAQALAELAELLDALPTGPIVTWNGRAADLPQLRSAAIRAGHGGIAERVAERHVDLYQWTDRSFALPISRIGLKEVGSYLGVSRSADVAGGLEALFMWQEYQRSRASGHPRTALRDQLVAYNRDDVDCLVEITEHLRDLSAGLPLRPGRRLLETGEVDVRLFEAQPVTPSTPRGFLRRLFGPRA